MAYLSHSPKPLSFPVSSSRDRGSRQLPMPGTICTNVLPLPTSYHPRQQSLGSDYSYQQPHSYGTGDSYFPPSHSNPSSIPSSSASTPAPPSSAQRLMSPTPTRTTRSSGTKRTSISSLLSTPDNSSGNESSTASSPSYWSDNGNSPTTTATISTRSNSIANTPISAVATAAHCYSPIARDSRNSMYEQSEDSKLYAMGSRKKCRNSRDSASLNDNENRDEYDVLGRKKPKTPRTPMSWDPKDDILLKQLKEEQRLGWKEIATHFRGRTSHACQFRWRRLASGQLKYYQGHRRPPPVTTTAASFANEMASTGSNISTSPKVLMSGMTQLTPSPTSNHSVPRYSPAVEPAHRPIHTGLYQPTPQPTPWNHHANIHAMQSFQPTPLPSPHSAPRFLSEDTVRDNWSEQEDALLLNTKLSFDEVNVLLACRSEREIWDRMIRLRAELNHRAAHHPAPYQNDVRRGSDSMDNHHYRIPSIDSVRSVNMPMHYSR